MEQKKDVIFIPYWIAGALERSNLPLSTALNYRLMNKFASAQDQANMLLFQGFNPMVEAFKGSAHTPSFGNATNPGTDITEPLNCFALSNLWRHGVSDSTVADDNVLLKAIENMESLAYGESTKNEVAMRFDPANAPPLNHTHPFITYDVEREVVFVVVYPGFFESKSYAENVFRLCKKILEVFYVYNPPSAGCKTPYFRKYLERLV